MSEFWLYRLNDDHDVLLAKVRRPDVPEIGLSVDIVGRRGVPSRVEHFRVVAVDENDATALLEACE